MPYIKADFRKMNSVLSDFWNTADGIGAVREQVASARQNLDWDVACENYIDEALRGIEREADRLQARAQKTVYFLGYAIEQYGRTENGENWAAVFDTLERQRASTVRVVAIQAIGTVVSVAIVIGSGGTAAPIVTLIKCGTSATVAMVSTGIGDMEKAYVANGNLDDMDWRETGKHIVVKGCIGWLTGLIDVGVGNGLDKAVPVSTAFQNCGKAVAVAGKAFVGGIKDVVSGFSTRSAESILENGVMERKFDGEALLDDTFDGHSIVFDFVGGAVKDGHTAFKEYGKVTVNADSEITSFADLMTGEEKVRYLRRQSGNYNTYNTDQIVADTTFLAKDGQINFKKFAPNDGAIPGTEKSNQTLKAGTQIQRCGSMEGSYVSAAGTPYEQLSLPYKENPMAKRTFEVIKDIPNVTISEAAPAFGMPGGAEQIKIESIQVGDQILRRNLYTLLEEGYIREVIQ